MYERNDLASLFIETNPKFRATRTRTILQLISLIESIFVFNFRLIENQFNKIAQHAEVLQHSRGQNNREPSAIG